MTYLLLVLALLWFAFGSEKMGELWRAYTSVGDRQHLLLRGAGFVAMGAWIHSLPLILLTIYMREEGILSTEVLNEDSARPVIATIYLMAPAVVIAATSCGGAIVSKLFSRPWRFFSVGNFAGYIVCATIIYVTYTSSEHDAISTIFLVLISIPLAIYLHLTLRTPIELQQKLYWAPFTLIFLITISLLFWTEETYYVVSKQLQLFGSGGCGDVKVNFKEKNFAGKLILLTEHSTYLLVVADKWDEATCTIRIPTNEALVAYAYDSTRTEVDVQSVPGTNFNSSIESIGLPEEYTKAAQAICGPVGKVIISEKGKVLNERASNSRDTVAKRRSCSRSHYYKSIIYRWTSAFRPINLRVFNKVKVTPD